MIEGSGGTRGSPAGDNRPLQRASSGVMASPSSTSSEVQGVLQVACQSGRTDIIQAVIAELGRSGTPISDIPQLLSVPRELDGATPLHIAALQGHVDVCRALLRAGADVRVAGTKPPVQRKAPFEVANSKECQQAFIMEAFGQVAAGNADRVRELVEGGLPVGCSQGSAPHDTLLHWAACFGHERVVEVLIGLGAQVNALNDEGVTPLHEAARNGQIRSAVHLLLHQADPSIKATSGPCEGKTPVEVAANHQVIELFTNISEESGVPCARLSVDHEDATAIVEEALRSPAAQGEESGSGGHWGAQSSVAPVEVRAMAAVTEMTIPMLWPPPKSCLLQADSRGVSHAWITRTVALVPPPEDEGREEEQTEGPAVEVLRSCLEAHGCTILPVSWNQTPTPSPSEGAGSGGSRPLLLTLVIKRTLFSSSQAYHLLITPTRIEITASDAAGLLYGAYTLADVIKNCGEPAPSAGTRSGRSSRASSFASVNNNSSTSLGSSSSTGGRLDVSLGSGGCLWSNTDRVLSIPTLCIRDWPDFPSRAVLLSARHSPRLTAWAVKGLARQKVNTINLILPVLPVAPSSRALAAARLLTLDKWCKRHHVDLVPTFLIDPARLDALQLAPPSGPWLRGFSSRQLAVVISPTQPPQEALSQARAAVTALEEALGPAGMLPGGWLVHVWGLPTPLAMDLAVSWLSRTNRGISVVAHGGGAVEATWRSGIEVGRALGRPAWVSAGLTGNWGPVLQLRRTLLSMVQLAQATSSSSSSSSSGLDACGERPAGYLGFATPFDNVLCPLLITQLVGFVAAGASWSAEGTATALEARRSVVSPSSMAAVKNATPGLGSLIKVFSCTLSRSHSWRHASPASPDFAATESQQQQLSAFLEVLLSFSPPRPSASSSSNSSEGVLSSCGVEKAEEALWSMALVHDLALANFHDERAAWRDALMAVHRHLLALARTFRDGPGLDHLQQQQEAAATPSVFSYAYFVSSSSRKPAPPNASTNGARPGEVGRRHEAYGSWFVCQEARLLVSFLRHLGRCLLHVLDRLQADVKGDVRFSLLNLYEADNNADASSKALPSHRRRPTASAAESRGMTGSEEDWASTCWPSGQSPFYGPLLASPELLPQTQRCDVANGLLDLYQQSLRLTSGDEGAQATQPDDEDEEAWGGLREMAMTWSGKMKDEGSAQEPLAITRRTITQLLKGLNFENVIGTEGPEAPLAATKTIKNGAVVV